MTATDCLVFVKYSGNCLCGSNMAASESSTYGGLVDLRHYTAYMCHWRRSSDYPATAVKRGNYGASMLPLVRGSATCPPGASMRPFCTKRLLLLRAPFCQLLSPGNLRSLQRRSSFTSPRASVCSLSSGHSSNVKAHEEYLYACY